MKEKLALGSHAELLSLRDEVVRLRDAEVARQRAESRLAYSEALSHAVLDSIEVGVIRIAPDGRIVHANAAARNNLELQDRDLGGMTLRDLDQRIILPDGSLLRYEDFPALHCLQTGRPQPPMTLGMRTTSGAIKWGVINVAPVNDPVSGQLECVMGTFIDISHTKQVEASLEESEIRYRNLVEQAPDAIVVHDGERFTYVNQAAVKFFAAQSPQDLIGRNMVEFVHPHYRELVQRRVRSVMQGTAVPLLDRLIVRLDGSLVRAEVTGIPCVYDGKPCVQTIIRDVTEKRRAERQIRRQREILRKFFDRIPVLVGFFDTAGRVKLVNREWKKVLGWGKELSIVELFRRCYPDADERQKAIEFAQSPPAGWQDFRVSVRDGRTLDIAWANIALSDGTHIAIGQDVTARNEAEKTLRRHKADLEQRVQSRTEQLTKKNAELQTEIAERRNVEAKLRDKQRFLERLLGSQERDSQLIAYEIHDTFLQDVIGALMFVDTFCERQPHAGQQDLEQLELARRSLRKAIVEARRMISGLRPPIIDEQGIVAAIEYLISEANSRGLAIDFQHSMTAPRLAPVAEAAIFRIVQEGIKNLERHSMARSGEVRITQTGEAICLEIHDQGVGFDPKQIEEGHYGLQGIQERARLIGGTVSIASAPGEGTHIVVNIPLTSDSQAVQPAEPQNTS